MRVRFFDGGDKFNIMVVDELRYDTTAVEGEPGIILEKNGEIEGYLMVDTDIITDEKIEEAFQKALENGYYDFAQTGYGTFIWSGDVDVDDEEDIK